MTPDEKREKVVSYLLHVAHLIENSDPESISGTIRLDVVSADRSTASLIIHEPSRERKALMSVAFTLDEALDEDGEHLEDLPPHSTDPGCGGNAHVSRPDLIDMGGLTNGHLNEMEDAKWLDFGVSSSGGRHIEIEPLNNIVMLTPTDLIDMWQAMGLSKKAAMSLWNDMTPDHVQDPPENENPLSGLTPGGVCRERGPGFPGPPGYDPGGRKKV